MKSLIVAALAAVGLGGCVAVPGYYPETAYYGPPAVSVGIGVSSPGYYGYRPRHRYHRRW